MSKYLVYELLKDAAIKWPNNVAIIDEYGSLTFEELYFEVKFLKNKLLVLGVTNGLGIGVKAKNGRNFIIGLFAAVGCGATVMPLANQLKDAEIENILKEAKLHFIIDDNSGTSAFLKVVTEIKLNKESFVFCTTNISTNLLFAAHVNNPAFIRFTSGTTGHSKGVIVSHQSVIERIETANIVLELNDKDTVIWMLPIAYHFMVSVILYVRFGAAIAIAKDFLAKNIIDLTNTNAGTLIYASPIQIRLLSNDIGNEKMPTLKRVISTSAGIGLDVCSAFKKRFDINVSQAYGIIEIGLPIINYKKSAEMPEAVGFAVPGYTVDILDDAYNPLPAGKIGYLGIKGPGMFDAYLLPATLRKENLQNGYFLTADFASKTIDGLIKIEGRSKSVINIGGIKIFPEEVEAVLESIPEIKQAKVFSTPHPLLGQIIEAEIIVHNGKIIDVEETILYCKKRLSNFKAPQKLNIVSHLAMTNTGKLMRY